MVLYFFVSFFFLFSLFVFFFFSSIRRHTRCSRDWSSDVCSSDLEAAIDQVRQNQARPEPAGEAGLPEDGMALCKVELVHAGAVVFTRDGLRLGPQTAVQIGRASCRERVSISVVGVSVQKKKKENC